MWEHLRQISDKRVRGFECITAPLEINPDQIADFQIDRIMKMGTYHPDQLHIMQ